MNWRNAACWFAGWLTGASVIWCVRIHDAWFLILAGVVGTLLVIAADRYMRWLDKPRTVSVEVTALGSTSRSMAVYDQEKPNHLTTVR